MKHVLCSSGSWIDGNSSVQSWISDTYGGKVRGGNVRIPTIIADQLMKITEHLVLVMLIKGYWKKFYI